MTPETYNPETFHKICPNCKLANPANTENCIMCDKDLTQTVLFIEDSFFDIEITSTEFIEYRKNYYRTRRTGKVKRFKLDKMKNIRFGYPIKRFIFEYNGKKEVYPLKDVNYDLMKEILEKSP